MVMQGVINIFGDIGVDVTLVDVIQQRKRQPDADSFIVNIDSLGGYVEEGFDIHDYLRGLQIPIHTKGRGVVASIATVIFLAGDTRSVYAGTEFMIHFPYVTSLENANSELLDEVSGELKKTQTRLGDFYSKKTNIEKETIAKMLKNETVLDSDQLFDLGFTTIKESVQIAAKLILTKEDEMNKIDEKVGKSLLAKIKALLSTDEIKNKILYAADERELDFPSVDEDGKIQVGDSVTVDGQSPKDGDILLKDGRTITVVGGKIEAITEAVTEEVVNKMLTSVDGVEVYFPNVADEDTIKVGDAVLIDGAAAPDGEITLSNGMIITVVE